MQSLFGSLTGRTRKRPAMEGSVVFKDSFYIVSCVESWFSFKTNSTKNGKISPGKRSQARVLSAPVTTPTIRLGLARVVQHILIATPAFLMFPTVWLVGPPRNFFVLCPEQASLHCLGDRKRERESPPRRYFLSASGRALSHLCSLL
jgi:hypothetical protein